MFKVEIQDILKGTEEYPEYCYPWEECNDSSAWGGFEDLDLALTCASSQMFEEHIDDKFYRSVRIIDKDGNVVQEDSTDPNKKYK